MRIQESEFRINDTACLFWDTSVANYLFVSQFNKIYGTNLVRTNDIRLFNNEEYPIFSYQSERDKIEYYLIDNHGNQIIDPCLEGYGLLMFIHGHNAFEKQEEIYNDIHGVFCFSNVEDPLEQQHQDQVKLFRDQISKLYYFDFRIGKKPCTSYDITSSKSMQGAVISAKVNDIMDCSSDILAYITDYLADEAGESSETTQPFI